jgi:hypothetical protein
MWLSAEGKEHLFAEVLATDLDDDPTSRTTDCTEIKAAMLQILDGQKS